MFKVRYSPVSITAIKIPRIGSTLDRILAFSTPTSTYNEKSRSYRHKPDYPMTTDQHDNFLRQRSINTKLTKENADAVPINKP